ncbi:uridine kinase family protein [Jiangella endophytica]|uniref:uridine kinase family protein n=1 Tax=Jiangella endophytica TaxID=1623398 RepID=UPI000E344382|nr:ATP-binding protein [Jiangella endophytica]
MHRVVLLAGPSGSGKSRLAHESGLPVLNLDHFYRDGDDPGMPRDPDLGIVDWDDPRSWDAERAVDTLVQLCRTGSAQIPVYDIAHDRTVGTELFTVGAAPVFVAEGLFAAEIVDECRARGVLADAIVLHRKPWKNFLRRLARDLAEHRKPPLTLLRRGRTLMRTERAIVDRQRGLGARPADAQQVRDALRGAAEAPSGMP